MIIIIIKQALITLYTRKHLQRGNLKDYYINYIFFVQPFLFFNI